MTRDARVYLHDIIEAMRNIEEYTAGLSFEAFSHDNKTIDAVVRNCEIIGEAAKNIPEEIKQQYSQIPWKVMAGMRDKLIHEYFGINLNVVWETITEDLPPLKPILQNLLKDFN